MYSQPIWAEVNMRKLESNLEILQSLTKVGQLMPVLKANAYGNGAVPLARFLNTKGINYFAVADLEEAMQLRDSGIKADILLLNPILIDDLDIIVENNLTIMVGSFYLAKSLVKKLPKFKQNLRIHIRVDIANNGLGIAPDHVNSLVKLIRTIKNIKIEGIFTHFYSAYSDDNQQFSYETKIFQKILNDLKISIPVVHAVSSGAFFKAPEAHYDYARIGTSLYGYLAFNDQKDVGLKPIMELKTKIVDVVDYNGPEIVNYNSTVDSRTIKRVAIIPVGYKHALYLLSLSQGQVIIKDRLVPILGEPCMNHSIVDVSDIPGVQIGDGVTIWGNGGTQKIPVEKIANQLKLDVVHHVILSMLSNNVPRKYIY